MKIVEYDPDRRGDVAGLMERVWGKRADERELGWFYDGNPVAPASVLLGEEDGRVVASVAMSFLRLTNGVLAGMPVHLATDPGYRGRGFFAELQAANEERARGRGARLLFVVPTPASARVLRGRLGWTPLPPLRVWARLPGPARRLRRLERFDAEPAASASDVVRDAAWLNWRFLGSPRRYTVLANGGYVVHGARGAVGVLVAAGGLLAQPRGVLAIAAPPRPQRARYLRAGWFPTPRTFALLGKSVGAPLPERVEFELGDLDIF